MYKVKALKFKKIQTVLTQISISKKTEIGNSMETIGKYHHTRDTLSR